MERYRFILGGILIVGLLLLAGAVALGKVEEKTSFGLTAILLLLQPVAQTLAAWAFPGRRKEDEPREDQETKELKP